MNESNHLHPNPCPHRRIHKLNDEVIQRIAAGEVIQRPANAIKELLENSVDAGATSISISVQEGGFRSLTIQDNGHGITREDLPLLCERYATSKLRAWEDLQTVQTFGFRGEALASISHVSRLSVTTKTRDSPLGWRANYLNGHLIGEPSAVAANIGTILVVQDLFYNNQVRLRATASTTAARSEEYRRIIDVVQKHAIILAGRCSLACRKQQDNLSNTVDFCSSGLSTPLEVLRMIYGEKIAGSLLCLEIENLASGYISSAYYHGKVFNFILFINGRLVESGRLKRAISLMYAEVLLAGTHPFVYLSLTIPGDDVDVNVHPTKQEVIFLHEDEIIDKIVDGMRDCIYEKTSMVPHSPPQIAVTLQTKLPLINSEVSTEETPMKKHCPPSAHSVIRSDHQTRTLDSFVYRQNKSASALSTTKNPFTGDASSLATTVTAKMMPSITAEGNASDATDTNNNTGGMGRFITKTVNGLIDEAILKGSVDVTEIIAKHVLVGFFDETNLLLQFETTLILANLPRLVSAWAYIWLLDAIADGRHENYLGLPIYLNVDDDNKDHSRILEDSLVNVDENGGLISLPALSTISWNELPSNILNILAQRLSKCWLEKENNNCGLVVATLGSVLGMWMSTIDDRPFIEHIILPALRQLPSTIPKYPLQLRDDGSLLKMATIHELYKIFDRC